MVSEEIKKNDPKIDGTPTKIAVTNDFLWVASGKKIWWYNEANGWSSHTFNNVIADIAAVDDGSINRFIYISFLGNPNVKRYTHSNTGLDSSAGEDITFPSVVSSVNVQFIYTIDNVLFLNANVTHNADGSVISCFYLDGSATTAALISVSGAPVTYNMNYLRGVAKSSSVYYLCTSSGIYTINNSLLSSTSTFITGSDKNFYGIINLNDTKVAAITRGGALYEITSDMSDASSIASFSSHWATGALTVWVDPETAVNPGKILLVGRQDKSTVSTGYTNGYMELPLDTNGNPAATSFSDPGDNSPSSVDNKAKYNTTMGTKVVNHIIQTPFNIDTKRTLFASTHGGGVWSYRKGSDNLWIWNAEE